MANTRGRPPRIKPEELTKKAYTYAEDTDIPVIAEFAHQNGITRCYLYELAGKHEDLANAIKYISEQKEVKLEKGALIGKYDKTMAIFSLKQLGWRDTPKEDAENALNKLSEIIRGIDVQAKH